MLFPLEILGESLKPNFPIKLCFLKRFFKGIVSGDWGGQRTILLERLELYNISAFVFLFIRAFNYRRVYNLFCLFYSFMIITPGEIFEETFGESFPLPPSPKTLQPGWVWLNCIFNKYRLYKIRKLNSITT